MMNIDTKNDENNDSNNLNNSVNDKDNDFSNNNSLNNVIGEKNNLYCAPCNKKVKKRDNVIKWDEYFMAVAFLSSMRSKDPSTQVGACVVNTENRIVAIGYNGFPTGCSDDELPWDRDGDNELDTKYPYVVHAEVNAILNKNSADVKGCTMYVALFPCNECAKMIIQSGIKSVVYMSDKYSSLNKFIASRRLLNMAGINLRQFIPSKSSISIDFNL